MCSDTYVEDMRKAVRINHNKHNGFISLLLLAASHILAGEYDVAGRVINTQKDPIKDAVLSLS